MLQGASALDAIGGTPRRRTRRQASACRRSARMPASKLSKATSAMSASPSGASGASDANDGLRRSSPEVRRVASDAATKTTHRVDATVQIDGVRTAGRLMEAIDILRDELRNPAPSRSSCASA